MVCTLNGTSPAGDRGGSRKAPVPTTGAKELLKTLTLPAPAELAAYNWVCAWLMANPV